MYMCLHILIFLYICNISIYVKCLASWSTRRWHHSSICKNTGSLLLILLLRLFTAHITTGAPGDGTTASASIPLGPLQGICA